MIIYKLTDRIPVKIDDIEFELAPLGYLERGKLLAARKMQGGNQLEDGYKTSALAVKYGVKGAKGLTYADGSPVQLEFETDGALTDASVSEIMQIEGSAKLMSVAMNFAVNVFKDPGLEGVTVDLKNVSGIKKN